MEYWKQAQLINLSGEDLTAFCISYGVIIPLGILANLFILFINILYKWRHNISGYMFTIRLPTQEISSSAVMWPNRDTEPHISPKNTRFGFLKWHTQRIFCDAVVMVAIYDFFMCTVILPIEIVFQCAKTNKDEKFYMFQFCNFINITRGSYVAALLFVNTCKYYFKICFPLHNYEKKSSVKTIVPLVVLFCLICALGVFFLEHNPTFGRPSEWNNTHSHDDHLHQIIFHSFNWIPLIIYVFTGICSIVLHSLVLKTIISSSAQKPINQINPIELKPFSSSEIISNEHFKKTVSVLSAQSVDGDYSLLHNLLTLLILCMVNLFYFFLTLPLFLVCCSIIEMDYWVLILIGCTHVINPITHLCLSTKFLESVLMKMHRYYSDALSSSSQSLKDSANSDMQPKSSLAQIS